MFETRRLYEGEEVDWKSGDNTPAIKYGEGPFKIRSVADVPKTSFHAVGFPYQWVQLSKEVTIFGGRVLQMIYDSFAHQWTTPEGLSDFGKDHPTWISAAWLRAVRKSG